MNNKNTGNKSINANKNIVRGNAANMKVNNAANIKSNNAANIKSNNANNAANMKVNNANNANNAANMKVNNANNAANMKVNNANNIKSNNANNANNSKSGSLVRDIIIASVILVIVGVLVYVGTKYLKKFLLGKSDQPWIIQDSKNAKNSLVITQDPKDENSITLYRSDDATTGSEFSYSFWFVIENMNYKYGELKHMFHKGNKSAVPNRAPGVYIHPTSNTILVYMNTLNNIMENIEQSEI